MTRMRLVAFAAFAGSFLTLTVPQLTRPFVYDEGDFVKGGAAILECGVPFYNRGYIADLEINHERFQYGFYHPPLYFYSLAASFALFGVSEWSARIVGVACSLATLFLTYFICLDVLRRWGREDERFTFLAVMLCAINPYFIQSSLLLDIDGSVQLLLITLFFAAHFASYDRSFLFRLVLLTAIFLLTMWSKLTTVIALPCSLGLTALFARKWLRVVEAALVGLFGMILWYGSWQIYALAFNLTPEIIFKYFVPTGQQALFAWDSYRIQYMIDTLLDFTIPWVTPTFFVLLLIAGVWRLWYLFKDPGIQVFDSLFVCGFFVFFYYLIKRAGGFPKYHIPAMPLAAVCIAVSLRDILSNPQAFSLRSLQAIRTILLFLVLTGGFVAGIDVMIFRRYHLDYPIYHLWSLLGVVATVIFFGLWISRSWTKPTLIHRFSAGLALIVGFTYGIEVIGDAVLYNRYHTFDTAPPSLLAKWGKLALRNQDQKQIDGFQESLKQYDGVTWWGLEKLYYLANLAPLCCLTASIIFLSVTNLASFIPQLIYHIVALSLGMALALSVRQLLNDFSTTYFYGDSGVREAAAFLNQKDTTGLYVAEGEVALYMRNDQYVEMDRYLQSRRVRNAAGEVFIEGEGIPRMPIHLFVARKWIEDFWPGPEYQITKRIGSFLIIEYSPRANRGDTHAEIWKN